MKSLRTRSVCSFQYGRAKAGPRPVTHRMHASIVSAGKQKLSLKGPEVSDARIAQIACSKASDLKRKGQLSAGLLCMVDGTKPQVVADALIPIVGRLFPVISYGIGGSRYLVLYSRRREFPSGAVLDQFGNRADPDGSRTVRRAGKHSRH